MSSSSMIYGSKFIVDMQGQVFATALLAGKWDEHRQ